jgi:hypothetical protein
MAEPKKPSWMADTPAPTAKTEKNKEGPTQEKNLQQFAEKSFEDFLIPSCQNQVPDCQYTLKTEEGKYIRNTGDQYLFYADTNAGKSYTAATWYDCECQDCHVKMITPRSGPISECPLCKGKVLPRPILFIDFEMGRAEKMKVDQFPQKNFLIAEVRQLNPDYNPLKDDDVTDELATEANFMFLLINVLNKAKAGTFLPSVLVIDSATDVWSIIQEWGIQQLVKYDPKYTEKNSKLLRTIIQTDWKIPNKRHLKVIQICRALLKLGIDIVWTARYEGTPDYVKDGSQKIRAQKDVIFFSDICIMMERRIMGGKNVYISHIEKLGAFEAPEDPINRISFAKIRETLSTAKKQKAEADAAESDEVQIITD